MDKCKARNQSYAQGRALRKTWLLSFTNKPGVLQEAVETVLTLYNKQPDSAGRTGIAQIKGQTCAKHAYNNPYNYFLFDDIDEFKYFSNIFWFKLRVSYPFFKMGQLPISQHLGEFIITPVYAAQQLRICIHAFTRVEKKVNYAALLSIMHQQYSNEVGIMPFTWHYSEQCGTWRCLKQYELNNDMNIKWIIKFIPGILDFYQNKDLKRSGQNYKYNMQSRPRCVYMDWENTSYGSSKE